MSQVTQLWDQVEQSVTNVGHFVLQLHGYHVPTASADGQGDDHLHCSEYLGGRMSAVTAHAALLDHGRDRLLGSLDAHHLLRQLAGRPYHGELPRIHVTFH